MTRRQANNLEKKIERGMKESFKKLVLRTRERNGELVACGHSFVNDAD